jgi:hypothetical protein
MNWKGGGLTEVLSWNLAAETEDNHEELLGVTLRNMNFSLSLFKKHIMETRGRVNA